MASSRFPWILHRQPYWLVPQQHDGTMALSSLGQMVELRVLGLCKVWRKICRYQTPVLANPQHVGHLNHKHPKSNLQNQTVIYDTYIEMYSYILIWDRLKLPKNKHMVLSQVMGVPPVIIYSFMGFSLINPPFLDNFHDYGNPQCHSHENIIMGGMLYESNNYLDPPHDRRISESLWKVPSNDSLISGSPGHMCGHGRAKGSSTQNGHLNARGETRNPTARGPLGTGCMAKLVK